MNLSAPEETLGRKVLLLGRNKDNRVKGGKMRHNYFTSTGSPDLIGYVKRQCCFANSTNTINRDQICGFARGKQLLQLFYFILTTNQACMLQMCQPIRNISYILRPPQFV